MPRQKFKPRTPKAFTTFPPNKPSKQTEAEILKHIDVQRLLSILEALLNGTQRVVIESRPIVGSTGTKHTFRVENSNAQTPDTVSSSSEHSDQSRDHGETPPKDGV